MDSDQQGLFEVQLEPDPTPQRLEEKPISEEQISMLRRAFDDAGIIEMAERQEIVQSCMIRPITTIRQLYAREFNAVLRRITNSASPEVPMTGSAWDNRDEDTWIDKL